MKWLKKKVRKWWLTAEGRNHHKHPTITGSVLCLRADIIWHISFYLFGQASIWSKEIIDAETLSFPHFALFKHIKLYFHLKLSLMNPFLHQIAFLGLAWIILPQLFIQFWTFKMDHYPKGTFFSLQLHTDKHAQCTRFGSSLSLDLQG